MLAELARALRGLGKHTEAQRCCAAAVAARPDYARGWLELGRAQAAQGELFLHTHGFAHPYIFPHQHGFLHTHDLLVPHCTLY